MKTMNKMYRCFSIVTCFLLANIMYGQTTILSESMGSVGGTTAISTHEAANGFDNDPQIMTGTADVRNTLPSNYPGASGLANIFFTNSGSRFFQIEGINTTGFTGMQLSFGIHKSTIASNGSDFAVEISSDGIIYTTLTFGPLPTGSGTAVWTNVTASGTIPATSNLRIRFTNTSLVTQYRVDDVLLSGGNCSATITADGPTTLCEGEDVVLTASSGSSYLWSNGATTQSITVTESGTFTVTVTDASSCTATSDPVRVLVYPTPVIAVTSSDNQICAGETVTLNARLNAPDLIISEYVEGTGNEKYVEIFNGTGVSVDLSNYHYQAFHNGVSTPSFDFALSGTLADGDVLVLKNGSAVLYPGGVAAFGVQHNGNDAIAIFNTVTSEYADIFGVIGHDPISDWNSGGNTTLNSTLRRNADVYSGITVNPDLPGQSGFTTLGTEWAQSATDDVSGLGSHSLSCNFSWSPATTPSSGCTVTATPASTTNYTATGTFVNGCSASGSTTVTVNEQPAVDVEFDQTIYLGYGPQCATLTADAVHGEAPFTFLWSNGATTQNTTVCPTSTTTYCATITDVNGCTSSPDCATVTVIDVRCGHNNNKVLVCFHGHTLCIPQHVVPIALLLGADLGPCMNMYSAPVETDMISAINISTYPNPFTEGTAISFLLTTENNVTVEVLDINGKTVANVFSGEMNEGEQMLIWNGEGTSGSRINPGIYLCRIVAGEESSTIRLILQ